MRWYALHAWQGYIDLVRLKRREDRRRHASVEVIRDQASDKIMIRVDRWIPVGTMLTDLDYLCRHVITPSISWVAITPSRGRRLPSG